MKRRDIKDYITNIQSSISGKLKNINMSSVTKTKEERVPYDESSNNGLIFNNNHYIPEEVLLNILSYYVDYKSLRSCQLVCKQWNILMKNYVWRKKAELLLKHPLPIDEDAPWTVYYAICHKKPFDRNLVKDYSGQKIWTAAHKGTNKALKRCSVRDCSKKTHYFMIGHKDCVWTITSNSGHGWAVENPPSGVPPLPEDPVFEGKTYCFVNSFGKSWKQQVVDLVQEGIPEFILDYWQPTIKVSEWYSCRFDCGAVYACSTELLTEENVPLSNYNYSKVMKDEEQNQWFKFEHEFRNYGKGLRKIKFSHGGQDARFWAGHYGSKMAGACIKLEVPDGTPSEETDQPQQIISQEPYYPADVHARYFMHDADQYDQYDEWL